MNDVPFSFRIAAVDERRGEAAGQNSSAGGAEKVEPGGGARDQREFEFQISASSASLTTAAPSPQHMPVGEAAGQAACSTPAGPAWSRLSSGPATPLFHANRSGSTQSAAGNPAYATSTPGYLQTPGELKFVFAEGQSPQVVGIENTGKQNFLGVVASRLLTTC